MGGTSRSASALLRTLGASRRQVTIILLSKVCGTGVCTPRARAFCSRWRRMRRWRSLCSRHRRCRTDGCCLRAGNGATAISMRLAGSFLGTRGEQLHPPRCRFCGGVWGRGRALFSRRYGGNLDATGGKEYGWGLILRADLRIRLPRPAEFHSHVPPQSIFPIRGNGGRFACPEPFFEFTTACNVVAMKALTSRRTSTYPTLLTVGWQRRTKRLSHRLGSGYGDPPSR